MSRRTAKSVSSKKTPAKPAPSPAPAPPQEKDFLERFSNWWVHFDRFGWDVLGILFIAFTVLTLVGLLGWTSGALLTPWIGLLNRWMGWGRYLVVIVLGLLGLVALRWRLSRSLQINLRKVLAVEAAAFVVLALLSIMGGESLPRAEVGLDGGVIGWGLATVIESVLPVPWSTGLLVLLLILSVLYGFGLISLVFRLYEKWLFAGTDVNAAASVADASVAAFPTGEAPPQKPLIAPEAEAAPLAEAGRPKTRKVEEKKPSIAWSRDERLPPLNLLSQEQAVHPDETQVHETAALIEKTLAEFGVPSRVVGFRVGPTVTQFAVEPGYVEKNGPDGLPMQQKIRVAQISNLAKDLALRLSAERLRIEAPVPGQSFVGIEVPNAHSTIVRLRPLLETEAFYKLRSPLALVLGKDVSGQPVIADLARMPHMLIAGTTGSGKSVCITAITACLMMNNTPSDLRIVMLDPKMVELVRFNGLPHLLGKVETEIDRMLGVLRWAQAEMDQRYRLLAEAHTRDLESYNQKMEHKKLPTLPRIVILVDELADLMMTAPDQTEHSLVRLAQMARATGIHMVVATQRPSVDVITGLIKANFPARISFNMATSIDSRVILDTNGAEALLGKGDMLFLNPENGNPLRAQGVLVTDPEIEKVVNFWQKMSPGPEGMQAAPWEELVASTEEYPDDLVNKAVALVKRSQRASASFLQRRLRIGYPRAARLLDELENMGIVGPAQGGGKERDVLVSADDEDISEEEDRPE
jgi:S-DNA-T family DNA segregation ATPase FtsK/SpoIIIE